MIKRIRWLVLGAATGVGVYLWVARKAKERVPQTDALQRARGGAGELGARVREAVREGRRAFERRRDELENDLLPRR